MSTIVPSPPLLFHAILPNFFLLQTFPHPPPNSQPIRVSLLSTSRIHTLYTLIIATSFILIVVEGLSSYQADITCQLLVQLLHYIAFAQVQHFRACPDDLPNIFGLPLHTTLSLLLGPFLKLLHTHSFYHYLEELPSNILYSTFHQVYLFLTQAEQQHYWGQTGIVQQSTNSPTPIPLALQISSCPTVEIHVSLALYLHIPHHPIIIPLPSSLHRPSWSICCSICISAYLEASIHQLDCLRSFILSLSFVLII